MAAPVGRAARRLIPGTEGASAPFWSPDSQSDRVLCGKSLKKVRIAGGAAGNHLPSRSRSRAAASWNRDGVILFAPGILGRLLPRGRERRQSAARAQPERVQIRTRRSVAAVPARRQTLRVLPANRSRRDLRSLRRRRWSRRTTGDSSPARPMRCMRRYRPIHPSPATCCTSTERSLMAQQFNAGRLEIARDPVVLAGRHRRRAQPGAGADLGFHHRRAGLPERGASHAPDWCGWIAPDGSSRRPATPGTAVRRGFRRTAAARLWPDWNATAVTAHLWLLDTNGGAHADFGWADARRVARMVRRTVRASPTSASRAIAYDIFARTARRAPKAELLLKTADTEISHRTGRATASTSSSAWKAWARAWTSGECRWPTAARRRSLNTVYAEGFATVSPDGKWMAYQSDQSGRNEVYVQAFDGLSERHPAALGGVQGRRAAPLARRQQRAVLHDDRRPHHGRRRFASSAEGGIGSGPPQTLFQTRPVPKTWNLYDVTPDGQHFLVNIPLEWTGAAPITVVTNWAEKLK